MARNGTGTYSLPALNPVVTGTTISSTWANNTLNDIATALTASVANDGQTPILANQDFGGFAINNVATPAQFDNDTSVATTAFVQRSLGNYGRFLQKLANFTVTNADAGTMYYISSASATVATFPASTGITPGASFTIINVGVGACVITPASGTIYSARGGTATYTLYTGQAVTITGDSFSYFAFGSESGAGTYTPVASNYVNCSAGTGQLSQYSQDGTIITVGFGMALTSAAGVASFDMTLPAVKVANFTTAVQAHGACMTDTGLSFAACRIGSIAGDTKVRITFAGTSSAVVATGSFSFEV